MGQGEGEVEVEGMILLVVGLNGLWGTAEAGKPSLAYAPYASQPKTSLPPSTPFHPPCICPQHKRKCMRPAPRPHSVIVFMVLFESPPQHPLAPAPC